MKVTTMPRIRPLSFSHRISDRHGQLVDRNFLMGRDPFEKVPSVKTGPPANIKEHDEYYSLEIPLTGYRKEEVNIIVENDNLIVRGKREEESVNEDVEYILKEYDIDSFERAFRLGAITDQNNITAKFQDGMLYIRLNHVEDKPKKSAHKSIPID